MSERFYLPADLTHSELTLTGPEAHHLAHVLRLGPGGEVVLFDGQGSEVDATIESASKSEVRLRPGPVRRPPPPTSIAITLAVAPPKGDRFRWLIEKATELGVSRLVPLLTERSVVDPGEGKLDKLRQTVIAASKQSGRCKLMDLAEPMPFSRICQSFGMTTPAVILQPDHPRLARVLPQSTRATRILLVGPEGGFTDSELDVAREAGALAASLGRTILRTETAALAAAAIAAQVAP